MPSRLGALPAGLPLFGQHRLKADDILRLVGDQLLELPVLFFQLPQPLRVAHHVALLRLPAVKRLLADPMLAARLRGFHARFRPLQNTHDLVFRLADLLYPVLLARALAGHYYWSGLRDKTFSGGTTGMVNSQVNLRRQIQLAVKVLW